MALYGLRRLLASLVTALALVLLSGASASATDDMTPPLPPGSPIVDACVKDPESVLSHDFDGDRTVVATVAGDLRLCDPIEVGAVQWTFMAPPSVWPQNNPISSGVVLIQAPGVYTIVAPEREPGKCHQVDFYAEQGKAPVYPDQLNGSDNPFEPHFLMDYSKGEVTYSQDSGPECADQMPPVAPNPADYVVHMTKQLTCDIEAIDVTVEYHGDVEATFSLQKMEGDTFVTKEATENVTNATKLSYTPAPGEYGKYQVITSFKDDGSGVTVLESFSALRPTIESCVTPTSTPTPTPEPTPTATATPVAVVTPTTPATLAATGFDGMGLAAGAGLLLLAGISAVLVAKRRTGMSRA